MDVIRRQNSIESSSGVSHSFSLGPFGAFALLLAVAALLASIGFGVYAAVLKNSGKKLGGEIDGMKSELATQEARETFVKLKKIQSAQALLDNRHIGSRVFALLENRMLPNVRLTNLDVNTAEGTFVMNAETTDLFSLARQVASFTEDKNVKSATFSSAQKGNEGFVTFDLKIALDPALFLNKEDIEGEK